MARNQVMKLWTAFVTAFLALCTALGLVTTTAAAAVARPEATGNTTTGTGSGSPAGVLGRHVTMPTASHQWSWSHAAALPPTMKQRIGAEAHGKSPSCRHRPLDETDAAALDGASEPATAAAPCACPGERLRTPQTPQTPRCTRSTRTKDVKHPQ